MIVKCVRLIELSVIIIQFVSTIVTAFYCSFCLSNLNNILNDNDNRIYLSDIKKAFKFVLNIDYTKYLDPSLDATVVSSFMNGTCSSTQCSSSLIQSNYWNGGYLSLNNGQEDQSNLKFHIINYNESCDSIGIQCFQNEYYKTCVSAGYPCPFTGLVTNSTNFNDVSNFYNINTDSNLTYFQKENEFQLINNSFSNSIQISSMCNGIPLVNIKVSVAQPCNYDYLIKSNMYVDNQGSDLILSYFNCSVFQDIENIPVDNENDFDLNYLKLNNLTDVIVNNIDNLTIYDERYIKIDQMDFKSYLKNIYLSNQTEFRYNFDKSVGNKTMNLYTRKLMYAKKECTVNMFKIMSLFDIYNIAQIRVIVLRYLNWNFIDIIFMIVLNIYTRGVYLVKKIRGIKHDTRVAEMDEKRFQQETNMLGKFLHYFIIVIKLISALVAQYIYMDSSTIPSDPAFYDSCLTDAYSIYTYKKINTILLQLYENTMIISNINIYTLIYDFSATMFIAIASYRNRILKSKIKITKFD